ncbi:acyltransferase family protein [Undibacterium sp. Di26W]|uniref:acyltransferase family protein n=1 Tax=Undibacterium sp. Di26W TaxID=3413035 RepID=UPI003BF20E65
MTTNNNKVLFAHQLRGLAALLVLVSHWFGVYWGMREAVSYYTSSPVHGGANPLAYELVSFNPNFGLGPFGVSIFFLISGFVIPISLEKNSAFNFLIMRFFRIFPTYWISLSIGLLFVYGSSQFWGQALYWNTKILVSNMLLINDLLLLPGVDLVNWTLAMELKFYLVVACLSPVIKRGKVFPLFIFSTSVLILNWCLNSLPHVLPGNEFVAVARMLASEFVYVQFMLVGLFFYYAYQQKISNRELIFYVLLQLLLFSLTWRNSSIRDEFPVVTLIYWYGLALFAVAYFFRNKFRQHAAINWLADISFPLYLLHSLAGYVMIKIGMSYGFSFYVAVLLAALVVGLFAYAIHRLVEIPTNAFGKTLSNLRASRLKAGNEF